MSSTEVNILEELKVCEISVWDAFVLGDGEADKAALDSAFLGVYSDGFACKSDHVQQLANGPSVDVYALSELKVIQMGSDHAVLSYRADFTRIAHTVSEAMNVSSIWRRKGSSWTNIFSLDTPAVA